MLDYNLPLDSDSYKHSHFLGYPEDVEFVYSYAESRGGDYPGTLFFGLQGYLMERLSRPITHAHVDEAADFTERHGLPFNNAGWRAIVDEFHGYLPLEIRGLDEGLLVPVKHPLVTVVNTDPRFPWLPGFVETSLLRQLWYATTVATRIGFMKHKIKAFFDETADNYDALPFALLDFSSRGCAGYDANCVGAAAYLTAFMGSDSMPGVRYANAHYANEMSGFSVPATEHSVMCSWKNDGPETIRALLGRMTRAEGGILSIVADTWNVFECARTVGSMADEFRAANVTAVVRPDSGDMRKVLAEVLPIVAEGFGTTRNSKGFDVINGAKVLQGDGINEHTVTVPFEIAKALGISAASVMTGSGGGLMQHEIDRDTCKFAFKASALKRRGSDGEWEGIAKDPITDPGKQSKKGRHIVIRDDSGGGYATISDIDDRSYRAADSNPRSLLKLRFKNGAIVNRTTLGEIRSRVDSFL
jgi:nicotinamide phosphoribosyltransferase